MRIAIQVRNWRSRKSYSKFHKHILLPLRLARFILVFIEVKKMSDIHFGLGKVNIHHPLISWRHLASLPRCLEMPHPGTRCIILVQLLSELLILLSAVLVPLYFLLSFILQKVSIRGGDLLTIVKMAVFYIVEFWARRVRLVNRGKDLHLSACHCYAA